jgi:hypothetical protein
MWNILWLGIQIPLFILAALLLIGLWLGVIFLIGLVYVSIKSVLSRKPSEPEEGEK